MSIAVGYARILRDGNFQTHARSGISEGQGGRGYYRNFDQVRSEIMDTRNVTNRAMQHLNIVKPAITAELYSPAVFRYLALPGTEYLRNGEEVRQVVTESAFTDIGKLANGEGFIVRVWPVSEFTNRTKVDGFYTPPVNTPANKITFKNPDHPATNKRLLVITESNASGVDVTTTTRLHDESTPDVYIVSTYNGADTSTPPIERLTLTYLSRGARPWDYSYERKLEQAAYIGGQSGPLKLVLHTRETFEDHSLSTAGGDYNGKRTMSRVVAPGTDEEQTTSYDYYQDPSNKYLHGRLKSVQNPDGSWEFWEYSDAQNSAVTVERKISSWGNVPMSQKENARKEETVITKYEATRTVTIAGALVSKQRFRTVHDPATSRLDYYEEQWDGSDWRGNRTTFAPSKGGSASDQGRPLATLFADGTAVAHVYAENNGKVTVMSRRGAIAGEPAAAQLPAITAGTQTVRTYSPRNTVMSESVSDIESGLPLGSFEVVSTDLSGRPTKTVYNGDANDFKTVTYSNCCGPDTIVERDGSSVATHRDVLKRVFKVERKASSTAAMVVDSTDFDGLTSKTTRSQGSTTVLVSESTRSLGGLTSTNKSPDADGDSQPEISSSVTSYPAGGGRQTVNTAPDGTTTSSLSFADGSTKSRTDQEGHVTTFDKGTHALNGGGLWSQSTAPNGTQWTKSYSDLLGRGFQTEYADGAVETMAYYPFDAALGSRGKLLSTTDPDENANPGTGSKATHFYNGEAEHIKTTTPIPGGHTLTQETVTDVINSITIKDTVIAPAVRSISKINGVTTATSYRSVGGGEQISASVTLSGESITIQTRPTDGAWTSTSIGPDGQKNVATYTQGRIDKSEVFDNQNNLLHTTTLPDNSTTHKSYTPRGQVKAIWGSQTYARLNLYDPHGRQTELRTYQNLAHGTEPTAATPDFAATQWIFSAQRGFLVEKNYHGESDDGITDADYTHTPAGRLKTRTWERGITTTYSYQNGQQTHIDYSDNTPDVSYVYDSFARPSEITQGNLSKHSFAYDPAKLVLTQEIIAYDFDRDGTVDFTRTIDRSRDNLLRPTGFQLKNGTSVETAAAYTFDNANRLGTVSDGSNNFTYNYLAQAPGLVQSVTGPAHTVTNTYEPHRNVLINKQNKAGAIIVSNFAYTSNNLGQRTSLNTTGSAFITPNTINWGYNGPGEVINADHSNNAFDQAWKFDGIGNRKTATASTGTTTYTANPWNQYTAITGQPAGRTQDADGNLTSGTIPADLTANSSLVWDAENRIIKITKPNGDVIAYQYDYQSRRITKKVTAASIVTTHTSFVYDDWNPIAEYKFHNSTFILHNSYTWGMDLSGTIQGAGGVGGLLSVTKFPLPLGEGQGEGVTYYPSFDGNGNVSEYLNATGTVVAHYEYDAFGNTIVKTGTLADDFAHRFSTKYLDAETGLYYYGYRYYDAPTGRWLSRDPIEEHGGLNLYGFVGNDGIIKSDYLGLKFIVKFVEVPFAHRIAGIGAKALTSVGYSVDYSPPEEELEQCDDIILVQTLKYASRLHFDVDWSIDNNGSMYDPSYLGNGGRPLPNSEYGYMDAPDIGQGQSGTWHIQVCALCLKCQCDDIDGTLIIKGSSSVISCTSFNFDNSSKEISNIENMKSPPNEWRKSMEKWKKSRVIGDAELSDWENIECAKNL